MTLRKPISFIATAQLEKAKVFYGSIMELELCEPSPFALVFKDEDHWLRVQIVDEITVQPYTIHGWQVFDIASHIRNLTAKGVVFEKFLGLTQDGDGIWTTPDGNKIAWFKDPCGNTLSLTEFS